MSAPKPSLVQYLLTRINLGLLNPDDAIADQEPVATCGASRTPVRAAGEAVALVRRVPRKGATIFRPTLDESRAILEVHAKPEGRAAGLAEAPSQGRIQFDQVTAKHPLAAPPQVGACPDLP